MPTFLDPGHERRRGNLSSLLSLTASGDQDAFASLFDHLAPTALGLLTRILGQRSVAEEVLQEVFLQVWTQAHLYRPDLGSVRAWFFTIVRSRGLDRLRFERSSARREELAVQDVRRELPPAQLVGLEAREHCRRLSDALEGLSMEQRDCIKMALYEELTHSKIAARLGAPLGTVKSRLRMGMMKVREALARDGLPGRARTRPENRRQ